MVRNYSCITSDHMKGVILNGTWTCKPRAKHALEIVALLVHIVAINDRGGILLMEGLGVGVGRERGVTSRATSLAVLAKPGEGHPEGRRGGWGGERGDRGHIVIRGCGSERFRILVARINSAVHSHLRFLIDGSPRDEVESARESLKAGSGQEPTTADLPVLIHERVHAG